jgi:hypothetical protein
MGEMSSGVIFIGCNVHGGGGSRCTRAMCMGDVYEARCALWGKKLSGEMSMGKIYILVRYLWTRSSEGGMSTG